jgi:chromosome segregation ATPase
MGLKQKLKNIGGKLKGTPEPSHQELLLGFIHDLSDVTSAVTELADEMHTEFQQQVVDTRPFRKRILSWFPSRLQPKSVRQEEEKAREITDVRNRVTTVNAALHELENSIQSMPSEEEMGQRIYEIAFPNEKIDDKKVDELEERLKEIELGFVENMQELKDRMNDISSSIAEMHTKLAAQGVKLDTIDEKIDIMDSRLVRLQKSLVEISAKISQNRTLMAFLAGAVIIAVAALIILV